MEPKGIQISKLKTQPKDTKAAKDSQKKRKLITRDLHCFMSD